MKMPPSRNWYKQNLTPYSVTAGGPCGFHREEEPAPDSIWWAESGLPFEIRAFLGYFFLKKVAKGILLIFLSFQIIISCTPLKKNSNLTQEKETQLSTPIAYYPSTLFEDSLAITFAPTYPGSNIHYTIDGSTPTANSPIFFAKQQFTSSTKLKALAIHASLKNSEMIELELLQAKKLDQVQEIELHQKPSDSYPGEGAKSLIDLQKGSLNFRENAWMGFDQQEVEINISFTQPQKLNEVILSTLQDHGSWIFLPEKIEVISENDTAFFQWEIPEMAGAKRLAYLRISLDEIETKNLRIRIINADKIPHWHPGAGHKPWLFVDEIIIR